MNTVGAIRAKDGILEDAIQYNGTTGVIADGHGGEHGAYMAEYACKRCMETLDSFPTEFNPEHYEPILVKLFDSIHTECLETLHSLPGSTRDDPLIPSIKGVHIRGGTTVVLTRVGTWKGRKYIVTANVGDSEAFILTSKNGVYRAEKLSTTDDPTNASEYRRIQKYGHMAGHLVYDTLGVTTVAGYLPIFTDDGEYIHYEDTFTPYKDSIVAYNAARNAVDTCTSMDKMDELRAIMRYTMNDYKHKTVAYRKSQDSRRTISTARNDRGAYIVADHVNPENKIRLGMTRSIGDYSSHPIGVSCVPHVTITWVDDVEDAVVFLSSDGILDCYEYDDLAKVVLGTPVEQLMDIFYAKSAELFQSCDDMSFVMISL